MASPPRPANGKSPGFVHVRLRYSSESLPVCQRVDGATALRRHLSQHNSTFHVSALSYKQDPEQKLATRTFALLKVSQGCNISPQGPWQYFSEAAYYRRALLWKEPVGSYHVSQSWLEGFIESQIETSLTAAPATPAEEHDPRLPLRESCSHLFRIDRQCADRFNFLWRCRAKCPDGFGKSGAGDGNRTHDIQLGKLSFYH
jgi:hypothetical protein